MSDCGKKKVIVAMSGGVDSSVAALLLQSQGYEIMGMFMRLAAPGESGGERAARAVAGKLGIKFYPVNLADKFKREVIKYFIQSYERGLTPNPCVRCNRMIKFGELLRVARDLGAEWLATGHYARLRRETRNIKIYRGKDAGKDQTYFLYTLTQGRLRHILFPLGEYKKSEVRKIADGAKLPYLAEESQDVCFLHEDGKIIEHNEYLKKYIKMKPGPIIVLTSSSPPLRGRVGEEGAGNVIGEHQGLPLYTLGQRRGIEIGGRGPYYAAGMDYKTNTLYVVSDSGDSALYRGRAEIGGVNWISGRAPQMPLKCEVMIRYRHKAAKCRIIKLKVKSNGVENYQVIFDEPQRAVTPGQSAVFYIGDEIIGGGVIG